MSLQTTRAILIERHGPPNVFVEREVPFREPASHEVHVRVEAAGLNFADLLMRAGLYDTVPPRPYSPGFEITGRIARAGRQVTEWREGDRVVALLRYGGYARDVIVPTEQVFPCPDTLTAAEAAAVPVAFLTGWVCLFECGHARAGEKALVLGAGGARPLESGTSDEMVTLRRPSRRRAGGRRSPLQILVFLVGCRATSCGVFPLNLFGFNTGRSHIFRLLATKPTLGCEVGGVLWGRSLGLFVDDITDRGRIVVCLGVDHGRGASGYPAGCPV